MIPTLKYYNQKIFIDDIQFPNYIVQSTNPDLAIKENVKEIYYQEYSNNNYIIFNDDSKEDLKNYEESLDKLIELKYNLEFEYKEELFKQQYQNELKPASTITIKDLFEPNLSEKEQQEKLSILKEAYPAVEFNDELYFNSLDRIKKSLLKQSDWTQLPDVQESFTEKQKKEWLDYRTTLRILDKVEDPLTVRVPEPPKI